MSKHKITPTDWDLLDALWKLGPATARQVADELQPTRGWAYSTVKTMLDRMVPKGLVSSRQVGNVWEYTPAVEPGEAKRSAWKRFVDAAFGGAVAPALQFVVADARLTKKQREQLLALLQETPATTSQAKEKARD